MSMHRIVDTSALQVACEIEGPETGLPVILLHGWPDDWRTWDRVLPALHEADYRTVVPSLRGFGETRFKSEQTMRSGQIAAFAQDLVELADALELDRFALAGHDWGARAAYVVAAQYAARLTHCVAMSVGYAALDPNQAIELPQIERYWYQWYMATPQGERLVRDKRKELARYAWRHWAPDWQFSDAEFQATAQSFDNPDWAEITLHSYRQRWGLAPGDPLYDAIEARMNPAPIISVPTLMIHGANDGASLPQSSDGKEHLFSGRYERIVLEGVGHFPQREKPDEVSRAVVGFLGEKAPR